MLLRVIRLAVVTSVVGLLAAPAAHASTSVFVQIGAPGPFVAPAPVYVAPAPPAYIWRPGYYVSTPFGVRWVPGTWVRRASFERGRGHERWEHERWEREGRGYDRDRFRDRDGRDWR